MFDVRKGISVLVFLFVTGILAGCNNETKVSKNHRSTPALDVATRSTLLATIAADEGPVTSEPSAGHSTVPNAGGQKLIVVELSKSGTGVAYIAQVGSKVCVVHNGKRGKMYDAVDSYTLTVSADGRRVGYGAQLDKKWYVVIDGQESGPYLEIGKPSFSPDSRLAAYEAKTVDMWNVYIGNRKSAPAYSLFHRPEFNSTSDKVFWLENTPDLNRFVFKISDINFNNVKDKVVHTNMYKTTADNEHIAAVDQEGKKQRVVEFSLDDPENVKATAYYDEIRELAYAPDGKGIAFYAAKGNQPVVVLNGKEELLPRALYPSPPAIRPDRQAAGVVISGDDWAYVLQAFTGAAQKSQRYYDCAEVTYSKDSKHCAYVAVKKPRFFIVLDGKEGPQYDRVVSPQFSPDGKYLIYRARRGEKRFVVVADPVTGKVIKEQPQYDRVFETAFTSDGKSVAYGVMDGNQLWWKVEKL